MRSRSTFREDRRAVETLPIRLVIALVVGVAAMGAMMTMIDGMGDIGKEELDAVAQTNVVESSSSDMISVNITSSEGEPVPGAKVMLKSGTAELEKPVMSEDESGEDGVVQLDMGEANVDFNPSQDTGTLKLDVVPPTEGNKYQDKKANGEIIVAQS